MQGRLDRNRLTVDQYRLVAHSGQGALGRGVEYQDMPLVRSISHNAAKSGNKFSTLVLDIVKSKPFLMNMKMQEASVQSNKEKGN